jgi:hypothetical protein
LIVPLITLSRREWIAVGEELNGRPRDEAPPGLNERITALLAATPAAWPDQVCNLELSDLTAADIVYSIVRQLHDHDIAPGFMWQEEASIAEAEEIIRDHQDRADPN